MATDVGGEHGGPTTPQRSAAPRRTAPASAASHHGSSVASWTMVLVVMLGALVLSVGIAAGSLTVDVVGVVIIVVGLVAGKVLSLAGYGTVKPADPEAPHGVA
jgi:lipopolysaccharide export LptBFGC system permease protein LptF